MVGGGVFGNRAEWIIDAIRRASCRAEPHSDLDVVIVSYRAPNPHLSTLLSEKTSE
jgi:hypothetical protein